MLMEIKCPLCGNTVQHYVTVSKFFDVFFIYKCSACKLMFRFPHPSKQLYDENYYSGRAEYSYIDEREDKVIRDIELTRRLKNILRFTFNKKNIRLLDIGCAYGALVNKAKEMGIYSIGYDISPASDGKSIDVCKDKVKHKDFDIVTTIETIEHLTDPIKALTHINEAMVEGGLLVIQTANFRSLLRMVEGKNSRYFLPGHLFYFTDRNLASLLRRCGFEVEKTYYCHETGFIPALIRKMLTNLGRHMWCDWLTFIVTFTIHLFSKLNILMPFNGGMVIYARKCRSANSR